MLKIMILTSFTILLITRIALSDPVNMNDPNDFSKYNKEDALQQKGEILEQQMAPSVTQDYGRSEDSVDRGLPSDNAVDEGTNIR